VRVKLRATEQGEKDEAVIYSIINLGDSATRPRAQNTAAPSK